MSGRTDLRFEYYCSLERSRRRWAQEIGRQLLRSSTGTAANYRACGRSRSNKEFASRVSITLEEADESALWLRLLIDGGISRTAETQDLLTEARELTAIFAASRRTALLRLKAKNRGASTRWPHDVMT